MANVVIMVAIIVCCVEVLIIWALNDELKRRPKALIETMPISEWEKVPLKLQSTPTPRTITAKDIAAGNLNRQVVRKSKSWADIRARVESMSDMDPEVARSKRVEKFIGDN
jgi:hypothetical protein